MTFFAYLISRLRDRGLRPTQSSSARAAEPDGRGSVEFASTAQALVVKLPAAKPAKLDHLYTLKIAGLKLR